MHCSTFLLAVAALSAGLASAAPAGLTKQAQDEACALKAAAHETLPAYCPPPKPVDPPTPMYTSPELQPGCYWTCPAHVPQLDMSLVSAQTPRPDKGGKTVTCKYAATDITLQYQHSCSFSISAGKNLDTDNRCTKQLTKSC